MANSLRAKLTKLRYDGNITEEEYRELTSKLNGHDKKMRSDAIDEYRQKVRSKLFVLEAMEDAIEVLDEVADELTMNENCVREKTLLEELIEYNETEKYTESRISRKFRDCKYELMEIEEIVRPCECVVDDQNEEVKEKLQSMLIGGIECAIDVIEKYIAEAEENKEHHAEWVKKYAE